MAKWRKLHGFESSVVAIGYDAGEKARVTKVRKACDDAEYDPSLRYLWYPLVAWGINRGDCETLVKDQGWSLAKSSCFMCPHMRKAEWEDLAINTPDLYSLALQIERGAKAAGHADRASLFRRAGGDCLCLADSCTSEMLP